MPDVVARDGVSLSYELDDFSDPWTKPETVLLVHGVAEASWSWRAWVPWLARHIRVVRPDLRGHGRSSEPPPGYRWNLDDLAADLRSTLDDVGIERAHVVSARFGATIAPVFAATYPERVRSLVMIGGVVRIQGGSLGYAAWPATVAARGVEAWADESQAQRLGDRDSPRARYWTRRMGETPQRTVVDLLTALPQVDIESYLPQIQAPTLVIAASRGRLQDIETVRRWQQCIAGSELHVVESDAYHVAATHPDELAAVVLAFLNRHRG